LDIATVCPTQFLKSALKCRSAGLPLSVTFRKSHQQGYSSQPITRLRFGRKRPRHRTADKRDELSPPHIRIRGLGQSTGSN
jgi:hypothetical protein